MDNSNFAAADGGYTTMRNGRALLAPLKLPRIVPINRIPNHDTRKPFKAPPAPAALLAIVMHKRNVRGMTLIELMITISLLAIVIAIGLPSFTGAINGSRLSSAANELSSALQVARAEAVRRNRSVVLCRSDDQRRAAVRVGGGVRHDCPRWRATRRIPRACCTRCLRLAHGANRFECGRASEFNRRADPEAHPEASGESRRHLAGAA